MQYGQRKLQRSVTEMRRSCSRRPSRSRTGPGEDWSGVSAGERNVDSGVQYRSFWAMQLLASEEYGLRCLIQVSRSAAGTPVSISQIADAEGLSPEYTAKLMRELRLGGLVESVRGADGGYRLTRPANEISVWSALQVLGGA